MALTIPDRIRIIDADSHITEPADLWKSRLGDAAQDPDAPQVIWDERRQKSRWRIGGHRSVGVTDFAFTGWSEFPPSYPPTLEDADPASWNPEERLRRMDEYGIHAQVLYPNLLGFGSIFFLDIKDPELRNRCVQAYNDYVLDFASSDPGRLIPLMWLPFWDVGLSVAEIERNVARGHRGIVFPSNFAPVGLPALPAEEWRPIWKAAQHHQMSVNFHVGFQTSSQEGAQVLGAGVDRAEYAKQSALYMLGNARTVADLTLHGICDRFPDLNFVSVESGFGWMPYFAELLDWQWLNSGARAAHPEIRLLPSEMIRRQVYGTFWFEKESLRRVVEIFPDNAMFSTDFPHPTSLTPGPVSSSENPSVMVDQNLGGLTEEVLVKILHDNAARIYHLT